MIHSFGFKRVEVVEKQLSYKMYSTSTGNRTSTIYCISEDPRYDEGVTVYYQSNCGTYPLH